MPKEDCKTMSSDEVKSKKVMRWNLDNLSSNEVVQKEILDNMKEKGQNIDEPKTPYHHSDDEMEDDSLLKDANQQIHYIATHEQVQNSVGSKSPETPTDEWDEDVKVTIDTSKVEKKEKSFEQRRKEHYNEFLVMKQLLKEGKLEDIDD